MDYKEKFYSILDQVDKYADLDTKKVRALLDRTDFFEAPASMTKHCSFRGGLCMHSIKVFQALIDLIEISYIKITKDTTLLFDKIREGEDIAPADRVNLDEAIRLVLGKNCRLSSVILVSLFHDLGKVNYYTSYEKSVYKGLNQSGKKIFEQETSYKVRDDAFVFGTEGSTSNYLLRSCIRLTYEEQLAIENCTGLINGMSLPTASKAWASCPLALYLHLADMRATYYDESRLVEGEKEDE